MTSRTTITALLVILCLLPPPDAWAQEGKQPPPEAKVYTEWIKKQVEQALQAKALVAANGNGVANQKESPSVDRTSTSLVDTTSASDFVSMALNLTGLRREEGEEDSTPTSGSVTVTVYSLAAAIKGVSPTSPSFYRKHTGLRRVSLTIGSEESKPETHFTDKPSTNLGTKILLINHRDVYSRHAQRQLGNMDLAVGAFTSVEFDVRNQLDCVVFRAVHPGAKTKKEVPDCTKDVAAFAGFLAKAPFNEANWPTTLKALEQNESAMDETQDLIARLAAGRQVATEKIATAVDQIHKGGQLAIAYFTKQREDDGTDEHRAELIFDYGLSERLNWTVNASFDFADRKTAEDTRRGRIATEFQAKLSDPASHLWSARPVVLAGGSEASKDPDSEWLVRTQVKLVVPVMAGVDIPIAYTYANRDADDTTAGSRLTFSLAIDPVRLRERLR